MEEVKASVQYGDMRGTIAVDGWDHLTALSVGAGGRKGYETVGFEFYGEPMERDGTLELDAYVYAVDESILSGKPGPDAVRNYAKQHGALPVFRFRSKLKVEDLIPLIKRLSVVLQDKATVRVPLVLVGGDKSYGDE